MTKSLLGKVIYFLIILLLVGVFLYCAWQLYAYFSESKETQGAYDALYDTGLTPRYGDKLITLSTCEYSRTNGRLIIVAKRLD